MDIITPNGRYRERFTKDNDYWVSMLCYSPLISEHVRTTIKERFPTAEVVYTPWSTKHQLFMMLCFSDPAAEAEFILCQESLNIDISHE